MEHKIEYVDIREISPHPKNPRKDFGDLSELAESIREQGVLQNLTVVPADDEYCMSCKHYNGAMGTCNVKSEDRPPCSKWESNGKYTVVIGHRRLAAAKLAGLERVPCAVVDWDEKTQISAMLIENINRSDLTVIEQAEGFQMMLDLGESVPEVAKATGFSETTVRRRVNLLSLDRKKLKAAEERGGTLKDYIELEQIKSKELKNKVLETIGTNNFEWKLNNAIKEEKVAAAKPAMIETLESFAKKIKDYPSNIEYVGRIEFDDPDGLLKYIPKPNDKREYKYTNNGSTGGLYRVKNKEKNAKKKPTAAELARAERNAKHDELAGLAYELRENFVKEYTGKAKDLPAIIKLMAETTVLRFGYFTEKKKFFMLSGCEEIQEGEDKRKKVDSIIDAAPERSLLVIAWLSEGDKKSNSYYDKYSDGYVKNGSLDAIYDCLCRLGYKMSDEEKALRDGTHELFKDRESGDRDQEGTEESINAN